MFGSAMALASAGLMATVILLDALMRRGVYSKWSQPLIISCALNPVFAAPVYLFTAWYCPPTEAVLLALFSGFLLALANGMYFAVLFSDAGECSELAAFDSGAPVGIALIGGLLALLGISVVEPLEWWHWAGVLIAPCALALLHLWSPTFKQADWLHRAMLCSFTFLNAVHMMCIDAAQKMAAQQFEAHGMENAEFHGMMSTYPFYWLGLLAGVLPILLKGERAAFVAQLPTMLRKWHIILLAEVIATAAFACQLAGFSDGHVAVIAVLSGSFSLLVFLGGIVLRRLGIADEDTFPRVEYPARKLLLIGLLLIGIGLAAWPR